ncbi:unnamed protein product [Parnassius mnemosyne]|uniref:Retroviral polymerase SH3-like domain-containing protein n=1 Tax=Parnassius mnemosyne TaxID=213953 RepID=A0AAV1KEK4_9NEOP
MKDICVANSERLQVLGSEDVTIVTKTDKCEFEIPVKDVLCALGLTTNLLSVSQLIKSNDIKGYRIYNPRTKRVTTSRDVVVMEDEKNLPVYQLLNSCSVGDTIVKDRPCSNEITMDEDTQLKTSDDTYVPSEYEDAYDSPKQCVRPSRIRMKQERYGMSNMCIPKEVFNYANGLSGRSTTRSRKRTVVTGSERRT